MWRQVRAQKMINYRFKGWLKKGWCGVDDNIRHKIVFRRKSITFHNHTWLNRLVWQLHIVMIPKTPVIVFSNLLITESAFWRYQTIKCVDKSVLNLNGQLQNIYFHHTVCIYDQCLLNMMFKRLPLRSA